MKKYYVSLLLFLLLAMSEVSGQGNAQVKHRVDSIKTLLPALKGTEKLDTYKKLVITSYGEGDAAGTLSILYDYFHEAQKQKDIDHECSALNQRTILFNSAGMFDSLLFYLPHDKDFFYKHEKWGFYYQAWGFLIERYMYNDQSELALQEAKAMYESAKKQDNAEGLGTALFTMSQVYFHTERMEEAYETLKEAIAILKKTDLYLVLIRSYYTSVVIESQRLQHKEALQTLQEWEAVLEKHKPHEAGDKPHYPSEYFQLFQQMAMTYLYLENADLAEKYIRKAENTDLALALVGRYQIYSAKMHLYIFSKRYDEALKIGDIMYQMNMERNNPHGAQTCLYNIATTAYSAGYYQKSCDTYVKLMALQDSMTTLKISAQIDELRSVYEVDKITAQKERTRLYLIGSVIVCLLLVVALAIWIVYARKVVKKNRSLYLQIQELTRAEKAAEQSLMATPEEVLSREMQLFRRLRELMKTQKLFTDAELNRKNLADCLRTNEAYLAEAIRKGAGTTFSTYIADLRLQAALELLDQHPEMTLDAVAEDSGHGSYSAFFRLFTKKYGISPSEYRKLSASRGGLR